MNGTQTHVPVMASEIIAHLAVEAGGIYVDGTFGRGGYSEAILAVENTTVWAIDRDPEAIKAGAELQKKYPKRLHLLEGRFSEMDELLEKHGVSEVNGV